MCLFFSFFSSENPLSSVSVTSVCMAWGRPLEHPPNHSFPSPQQTCPQLPSEECSRERTPIYVRISSALILRGLEQVTAAAESVLTRRRVFLSVPPTSAVCSLTVFPKPWRKGGGVGARGWESWGLSFKMPHEGLSPRAPYSHRFDGLCIFALTATYYEEKPL